jgi:general secretion pathway protein D
MVSDRSGKARRLLPAILLWIILGSLGYGPAGAEPEAPENRSHRGTVTGVTPPLQDPSAHLLFHEVLPGDTVGGIAKKYGLTPEQIYRLNDLTEKQVIRPGQRILVSPAETGVASNSAPRWVTMNFKDVELDVFIKFISELTGKNFLVDPSVRGRVTILSPEKVSVDEAYKVFLSVLEVNDLTVIQAGSVIKIIKSSDAKGKGVETLLEGDARSPEDRVVTQLCALKYASASELAKLLRPLIPRNGLLIPYPDTNTVIIIDVQSNVDRLVGIVKELDIPGHEEIHVFMLEYARAEKLAAELRELFQEAKGRPRTAGPQGLKILSDERTNSLIILASPKDMASMEMLIERLDRRETKQRASIHIYPLENAVAEDLAKVLSEIPGKGVDEKDKGKSPLISKEVQISADKATNSLVIIAEQEEYELMEEIIRRLDIPRIMVYVEALIIEVSADKALQLGVEWRVGDEFDGGFGVGSSGGVWMGQTPGAGELDNLGRGNVPGGFAAGVIGRAITLGDVVFPSIGAFVRAVRSDSNFNVISTPQILTLDNQEAVIEVAKNIPFVTRIDQGTEITSRAIQNFEYRDVGVILKVTPQINHNRFVRLNVEQTVSRVLETTALGGTVLAPTTTKRSTKSTITVKDGETAVMGGLIDKIQTRTTASTPCLGGLPGVGWLFKQTSDRDDKTNLLVFLTPHIIENVEEGRILHERKREHMDEQLNESSEKSQPELFRRRSFR